MKEQLDLLFIGTEINHDFFKSVKAHDYFMPMINFIINEHQQHIVYPPLNHVLEAFKYFPLTQTKIVIIGQDPYHGEGEANGLCFSVNRGIKLPPSLINIYREIGNEYQIVVNQDGDLSYLARQGVLLLNVYLTVKKDQPLSHAFSFYEAFMHDVIAYLEKCDTPIVYMLWGSFAKRFIKDITNQNHYIVTTTHPSPLSANRGGWFNQKQFLKANEYLIKQNISPIKWFKDN